jgi:ElaB/YqjD/DUF883 family membrane-anchored ribosome-binding protein
MNTSNPAGLKASVPSEDLAHQLEVLRADVSKLMSTVSDDVSEGLGQAGRQIRRTGRDAQASATNAVLENPLTALGIAVGVGLLLGLVTRKA